MAMLKGRWGSPSMTRKRPMAGLGVFVKQVRNGIHYVGKPYVLKKLLGKWCNVPLLTCLGCFSSPLVGVKLESFFVVGGAKEVFNSLTQLCEQYPGKYPVCCGSLRCGKELPLLEKVILCQKDNKKVGNRSYVI